MFIAVARERATSLRRSDMLKRRIGIHAAPAESQRNRVTDIYKHFMPGDEIACTAERRVRLFLIASSRLSLSLNTNSQSKGNTHGSRSSNRKTANAGAIIRHLQCVSTNPGNQSGDRTRTVH